MTISSPKDGASINASTVTITGTTQAGTVLLAHNAANGLTTNTTADANGKFSLTLPVAQGSNEIDIQATDPAGNQTTATLTVKQGAGNIHANLSASTYRISVSKPPNSLQLRVLVTDPDGAPLPGAIAAFTVQIPGLGPISNTVTTDANGRASFTISLVGPMKTGNGLATVLVTYQGFGDTSDRVSLTFVK
jgi:hypothetical protein